jgi:uncharacterized sulfatase
MRAVVIALVLVAMISLRGFAAPPPNVVMIISDDQGWTDFGFMGHESIKTPSLDKLAAESAVFVNGYVPTSLCRASLATLLTGLYGTQHKICCNDFPMDKDRSQSHAFIQRVPTVPRLLGGRGYASLQTGKFWEGHFSNGGFTDGMTTHGRHGEEGLLIGRQTMQPVFDFIDRNVEAKKPFFVWYAPMMPHNPHNPPKRILEKYTANGVSANVALYFAMCEWFDETCGQLIDYLDSKKLRDNTLIVFVIDNGWVQDPKDKNKSIRSKLTPYDDGLRTPIMLSWPGHVKPGKRNELATSLDLAPTILNACGAAVPETMAGANLLDVAEGHGSLVRDAVFGEIFHHEAADLNNPQLSMTHRWVRQGDWKLIVPTEGNGKPQLFNLKDDPHEKNELAEQRPQDVERLRAALEKWWTGIHPAVN